MKTRWCTLRNEGILLLSSQLIISMVMIIIKYILCSQRTQLYFDLQQYFVVFTNFWMKYHEYYIFIKYHHVSASVWLLFLVVYTPYLLTTCFYSMRCFMKHSLIVMWPGYKIFTWTWNSHRTAELGFSKSTAVLFFLCYTWQVFM